MGSMGEGCSGKEEVDRLANAKTPVNSPYLLTIVAP